MKHKNLGFHLFIVGVALLVLAIFFVAMSTASAEGSVIQEWYRTDGSICSAIITEYGVAIDCDCPCGFSPEPTVSLNGETPVPSETAKPKCNSGRGNGSEGNPDCDPGNSGKNQGGD